MSVIKTTINAISQLIWPSRCASCDQYLPDEENLLCVECDEAVATYAFFSAPPGIDYAASFFFYDGAIRELIASWKYHEDFRAQKALLSLIERYSEEILPSEVPPNTIVVPIPAHPARLRERGYDPAWKVAEAIAKNLNRLLPDADVKLDDTWFKRSKYTVKQASLPAEKRSQNLENAFTCSEQRHDQIIILVDDVYTTGATAMSAAKTLQNNGAAYIFLLTAAKADRQHEEKID